MVSREFDWEGVRLHVVTGKGGTGKTTVAAALALALAGDGRRTLLVEVEGRQGIAQLFDSPPLPYEERKVAVGPGGGDVFALAIDPEEALLEYLEMFYKLGRAGRGLRKIGAIDFATTIAPGLRDVLLTGKVYEAVRRRQGGRSTDRVYDAVVLDAPPTGRITRFLSVNAEVAGLAKVGPIRGQADSIMALLDVTADRRARRDPAGGDAGAGDGRRRRGAAPRPACPSAGSSSTGCASRCCGWPTSPRRPGAGCPATRSPQASRRPVSASGPAPSTPCWSRSPSTPSGWRWRSAERRTLKALGRPTYELPLLSEGVDLGGLYQLAERLCAQGAA